MCTPPRRGGSDEWLSSTGDSLHGADAYAPLPHVLSATSARHAARAPTPLHDAEGIGAGAITDEDREVASLALPPSDGAAVQWTLTSPVLDALVRDVAATESWLSCAIAAADGESPHTVLLQQTAAFINRCCCAPHCRQAQ